ncbi:unnamed protein product [Auanema sp. JU1783]|nr:unnamed protein product [Auanema sp. JU1783]
MAVSDSTEEPITSEEPSLPLKLKSQARRRKTRVLFSEKQISRLEALFQRQQYVSALERHNLSQELDMTSNQIKIWFQNRRYKNKRLAQDCSLKLSQLSYEPILNSIIPLGMNVFDNWLN